MYQICSGEGQHEKMRRILRKSYIILKSYDVTIHHYQTSPCLNPILPGSLQVMASFFYFYLSRYCDFTNTYQKFLSSNSTAADRNKAAEHDRIMLKIHKTETERIIKNPNRD